MPSNANMHGVFSDTLVELAEKDSNIVVVAADMLGAAASEEFRDRFPDRVFDVGVAEANMVGIAAGLSAVGKIPLAGSFACFSTRRTYDQLFVSACYARLNVKLRGISPGIVSTFNGGTHMAFEDIGLMRNIPGMLVIEPSDGISLRKLLIQSTYHYGCVYLRTHQRESPVLYTDDEDIQIGKGKVLRDGTDVTLIASGAVMVNEALKAAELLNREQVSAAVIDMHTIKPLDEDLVLAYAERTGAIVTCENHQIMNGLGSAVAETLSERKPTLLKRVGVRDQFGEVGTLEYLQERYGLRACDISTQALQLCETARANS